jgi:hypothetical protein
VERCEECGFKYGLGENGLGQVFDVRGQLAKLLSAGCPMPPNS